jgi:asparagine synthase (glutamine-hydrolysing)
VCSGALKAVTESFGLMCGVIAGISAGHTKFEVDDIAPALARMALRGPDAEGVWYDNAAVLGHRRLAILDLDPRSHQPMVSGCGRYVISYNGEIYNFRQLRDDLKNRGTHLRTLSDTEVVLELFALEGAAALKRLRGMFAFIVWDRIAKRGFIARDPYGIKPLYYANTGRGLLVGSQVKALLATGLVAREPDAWGQAGFWLLGSVPEPHTWFKNICALPAGHFAWIQDGRVEQPIRFWDIATAWREAPRNAQTLDDVQERIQGALRRSVSAHLVSDVPVGIFLSGGIDSGALAGLISDDKRTDISAVTIAFSEYRGSQQDESPAAAQIAAHYGITHDVRIVTKEEFYTDLPRVLNAMDQPSIDGINTWYASKAVAERGLKVVISGIGGDELFLGYSSFRQVPALVRLWKIVSRLHLASTFNPVFAFKAFMSGNSRWRYVPRWAGSIGGSWWLRRGLFSPDELPDLMGKEMAFPVLNSFDPSLCVEKSSGPLSDEAILAIGQVESTNYLRHQLLRDSDWASMDHSVELRTPLVDAWLLQEVSPYLSQFRDFPQKALLADAPSKALPKMVVERKKSGFGIPIGAWLKDKNTRQRESLSAREWSRRVVAAYNEQNLR